MELCLAQVCRCQLCSVLPSDLMWSTSSMTKWPRILVNHMPSTRMPVGPVEQQRRGRAATLPPKRVTVAWRILETCHSIKKKKKKVKCNQKHQGIIYETVAWVRRLLPCLGNVLAAYLTLGTDKPVLWDFTYAESMFTYDRCLALHGLCTETSETLTKNHCFL